MKTLTREQIEQGIMQKHSFSQSDGEIYEPAGDWVHAGLFKDHVEALMEIQALLVHIDKLETDVAGADARDWVD